MASNLINDVRYSLRGFARRPVFAAVIVATLALAIGLNVAVFSVYDQVMLRRLPVADPASLVNFVGAGPHPGFNLCGTQGVCDETFSYPMFRDLERATTSGNGPLAGIAATKLTLTALGFEQRTTNFAQPVLDVLGRQLALSAKVLEDAFEAACEGIEHGETTAFRCVLPGKRKPPEPCSGRPWNSVGN